MHAIQMTSGNVWAGLQKPAAMATEWVMVTGEGELGKQKGSTQMTVVISVGSVIIGLG